MKKKIISLMIATSIIGAYIPQEASAYSPLFTEKATVNEALEYVNGIYTVKNQTLKVDKDENSAARAYVKEESIVEVSEDFITATIDFTDKSIMSNTKISVNGEVVNHTETEVDEKGLSYKFNLNSLEDDIVVATTINLGFMKMNVSFRVVLDTSEIVGSPTTPEPSPEPSPEPTPEPNPEPNPGPEEGMGEQYEGLYTIENDTLHISKDEESLARSYLEKVSDIEFQGDKVYLTLKFTGKSMMENHIIKVNGTNTNFQVVNEEGENYYIKFLISGVKDNITVSTKVLGSMNVEFRVKLLKDTIQKKNGSESTPAPSPNPTPVPTPVPTPEVVKPVVDSNKANVYKVQNEIITDSAIGYSAARGAVNSTSYIEEIEGKYYITIGLSQLNVMSNIRVKVNGASTTYNVVRKDNTNNTMDIRFMVPSIDSAVELTAFINMTNRDISFGIDFLEGTMVKISSADIATPLATPTNTSIETEDKTEEKVEENSIEAKNYFKKYTIENDIVSDSAMGKAMTRKYVDKLSIVEDIDGKLYLTVKFSGTDAMDKIRFFVNGTEVEYDIVAEDVENGTKAFRFLISSIEDEINVSMFIKPVKMDIEFGIDLLAETQVLVEEGIANQEENAANDTLNTLMTSNPSKNNNFFIIGITAITAALGLIVVIMKKKLKKKLKK